MQSCAKEIFLYFSIDCSFARRYIETANQNTMIVKLLSNSTHVSSETAHVIKDWPYGRQLRCEKRLWIEFRPKFGFRAMEQTTNPKRGNSLNKPHAGQYREFIAFGEDKDGLLTYLNLTFYSSPEEFAATRTLPLDEGQIKALERAEKLARAYNKTAWAEWDAAQGK